MFGGLNKNNNGHKKDNNGHIISMKEVVKIYHSLAGDVTALKGINLNVKEGELVVITGKSGAGKTTLINLLSGLDRMTSGEIHAAGADVHKMSMEKAAAWRGKNVGVVFQTFELLQSLSVLQNVMLPMDFANRYSKRQQKQRALYLLEQVEIAEHAYKKPTAVSGGQQQRVAIARAMANNPPILVADEPTGSLDSGTAKAVLNVFETLAENGTTIILVTHDKDIAQHGSRIITLHDGEIVDERN